MQDVGAAQAERITHLAKALRYLVQLHRLQGRHGAPEHDEWTSALRDADAALAASRSSRTPEEL